MQRECSKETVEQKPSPSRAVRTRTIVLLSAVVAMTGPPESVRAGPISPLSATAASLVAMASDAQARTWTDSTGKYTVEAELVDYADGVVRLRKTDGQVISLSIDRLSAADQEFVKQQAAGDSQIPAASAGAATPADAEAVIELLTGATTRGRIVARDDQYLTVMAKVGSRTLSREYPLNRIHAITVGGKREIVNEMAGGGPSSGAGSGGTAAASLGPQRSRADIEALIDRLGRTPPDWWNSVTVDYPKSLDLSWPQRPPPPWNPRKNVGQYLWDIIQPNPGKWREGVRFVHYLLELHKGDRAKRTRAMNTLGRLYYLLLQDYARAAFWWRQAGIGQNTQSPAKVNLATCYWKLGNKRMALDLAQRPPYYFTTIKLLADMGEIQNALQIAESGARGDYADIAYLYAGDACRVNGRFQEATRYYEKVLDVRATGKMHKRIERNQQRARANIEGIRIFDTLDLARVADGVYRASSPGYAGQLHVEVTVRSGRIDSVKVTKHQEKQFYTALTETPEKIIQKQGVKGVDATSSATITSEAIINATAKALATGLR